MFKTELYRIYSRRALFIAVLLGGLLLLARFQMMPGEEVFCSGDGKYYVREAAISRNKEMAKAYEGPITVEKIMDVWEKYGPYDPTGDYHVNFEAGTVDVGYRQSFMQDIVMNLFCRTDYSGEGEVVYEPMSETELRNRGYLDENLYFTYTGDWYWYWDSFLVAFIVGCLLIIIGLAPLFAEDHALHVSDLVVTCENGRQKCYRGRILAGLSFASLLYWILQLAQLFLWAWKYGWNGLLCSTIFTQNPDFYDKQPLWMTIATMLLCGWLASLILSLMVMAVSAGCKQVFPVMLISLVLLAGPMLIMEMFLAPLRSTGLVRILKDLLYSMPVYYNGVFLECGLTGRMLLTGIIMVFGTIALISGRRSYCRLQK